MRYLTLSLILIISSTVLAQTQWGLRAGMNFNDIRLDNAPFLPNSYFRNNISFHIGTFVEFSLNKKLAIHSGLQFIQKGANSSNYNNNPATETRINLNYLEAPLLISFRMTKVIILEAGPSIGYKLSVNETPVDYSKILNESFDQKFDFGLNAGLRVALSKKVLLWGRYFYGLSEVNNFSGISLDPKPTSKNRNFQLGLGYIF